MSDLLDAYESALKHPRSEAQLRIAGFGRAGGGRYGRVVISGSGEVDGDVEAEQVRVAGSALFDGDVRTRDASVSGAVKVRGNLKAERLHAAGAFDVLGRVEAEVAAIAGVLKAGEVKARELKLSGTFRVGGKIEGERVSLRLSDDAEAGEVKASLLEVRMGERGSLLLRVLRSLLSGERVPSLTASKIEAKEAVFDGVVVKASVAADVVKLRGGARVEGSVSGNVVREY